MAEWKWVHDVNLRGKCAGCNTPLFHNRDGGIVEWAGKRWHIACTLQHLPEAPPAAATILSDWGPAP